jgi:IS5 family transposase
MDSMTKRKQNSLFITLDDLVSEDHPYRKLDALLSFDELANPFLDIYSAKGRKEKGVSFGLRTLVLQFIEDISDREMERFLRENNSAKWFCELGLTEKTPDHSYFGDFRKRLGTKNIMAVFQRVRESFKAMGLIREVFTFVDASHLISKLTTWDDRDRSIKAGLEKFNNDTAEKIAVDPQARFGCKGGNKFWYGYKEHASVDMQSGLINKIAATSAEVTDASGLTHVCPNGGAVFGDKGYCVNPAKSTLKRNGCHDATIKKANMKGKDTEKDRWISKMRSPYERVFAHRNRRVRYRGLEKVQFQVGIRALTFNLKRMIILGFNNINLVPA